MKRPLLFLLLASLGLNVGLGIRALRDDAPVPEARGLREGRRHPGPEHGGPGRPGRRFPGAERFQGLELSADQEARLQALRDDHFAVMRRHRTDLDAFRDEMRALFGADVVDRARVAEVRRRHGRLQAELDSLVTEQLLRELEVLTPGQRRLYLERMPWRGFGPGGR